MLFLFCVLKFFFKLICGEVIDVWYVGVLVFIDLIGGILLLVLYLNVFFLCRFDEYCIGVRKMIFIVSYKFFRNDFFMLGLLIFLFVSDVF